MGSTAFERIQRDGARRSAVFTLALTALVSQSMAVAPVPAIGLTPDAPSHATGPMRAPAAPVEALLTQPDGTTIAAVPWGDETSNGYQTVDGYTVVQVPDDTWVYATGLTKNGKLKPSAVKAEKKAPAGTPKQLRPATEAATEIAASPPGGTFSGTQRSLVLLVDFPDRPPVGTVAADWYEAFFGTSNSVADFYDEASYGALALTPATESEGTANDGVVGWLHLPYNHPNTGFSFNAANQQLAKDAILAADPHVDFASFDTSGNGAIESRELHVTIIVAGYEASYAPWCGASVWGHKWNIQVGSGVAPPVVDGTTVGGITGGQVSGYTQFGEWHCNNFPASEMPGHPGTIGIIVHEMGHDLGWPDLYDTDLGNGRSNGVGDWSVMGHGLWNRTGAGFLGSSPALPDAFLRTYQGWATPTEITDLQTSVPIAAASAAASVKRLGANPGGVDWSYGGASGAGEYFLVENRQRTGYDAGLPGCGILVWHIDETRTPSNAANAVEERKLVDLEEADGLAHLDTEFDQGNAGDAYPGSTGNQLFNGTSNPNSNWYSGDPSNVTVQVLDTTCSSTMNVNLSVEAPNTAPVAVDDSHSTLQGTALSVPAPGVLGNDSDADLDTMTAVLDTDVANGTLALTADGSFVYTPDPGYNGLDSFTYHANDGTADSNTVTVSLTVVPPTLISIAVTPVNRTVAASRTRQYTATGTYSDASTANLTGSVTWASDHSAATIDAAGLVTGIAEGTATISATLGLVSGSTELTVTAAPATSIELAGVGPGGALPDGYSFLQDVSADGSLVFLSSSTVSFGLSGPNWYRVYLRSASTTTAVNTYVPYPVERAGISDNGRYVVYTLGYGDAPAVYLYDTTDQTTTNVVTIGSTYPEFVQNSQLDVSDDGRYVLFDTVTGLGAGDTNGVRDVYRYDRQLASLDWVSRNPDGTPSDGESTQPHMTPDGGVVVFTSVATNLVAGDTNAVRDAFRWTPASLDRVSTDASGTQLSPGAGGVGIRADVTDDGRYVVFDSSDALVSGAQWWNAVILKDTVTGDVEIVSHDVTKRDDVNARFATISGDGSVVAYESDWPFITTGIQGSHYDAVAKDRASGTIELVSSSWSDPLTPSNGQANNPIPNADGTIVAFDSFASDVVQSTPVLLHGGTGVNVYRARRTAPDTTSPEATITTPADGATYDLGSSVIADYTCTDGAALAALNPCVGTVPAGTAIDTSVPGPQSFSVTATDAVGLTATMTASYTVSRSLASGLALTGTFTTIPAGYTVTVTDAGADGVTITVTGSGTDKVVMSVCGGYTARIAPGSTVTLACGSVVADVAAGSVEVEIVTSAGPVVLIVPAGGQATLENDGSVVVAPTSSSLTPVTVTVAGVTQPVTAGSTTGLEVTTFLQPIDGGGVWNTVKGGSTVPVKFQVFYGTTEITDPAVVRPITVAPETCPTGTVYDAIEELSVTNSAVIRYSDGSFIANWKTPKTKNKCQRLTVTTTAGTSLSAFFKLR